MYYFDTIPNDCVNLIASFLDYDDFKTIDSVINNKLNDNTLNNIHFPYLKGQFKYIDVLDVSKNLGIYPFLTKGVLPNYLYDAYPDRGTITKIWEMILEARFPHLYQLMIKYYIGFITRNLYNTSVGILLNFRCDELLLKFITTGNSDEINIEYINGVLKGVPSFSIIIFYIVMQNKIWDHHIHQTLLAMCKYSSYYSISCVTEMERLLRCI